MFSKRKISIVVYILEAYLLFSFHFIGTVYAGNDLIGDNVNIHQIVTSKTSEFYLIQNQAVDYSLADTIPYFHSSEGYFPGLLHNFEEQAAAPFHFSAKEWIITGAAVGITAALISVDGEIDNWAKVQKQQNAWVAKTSPVITSLGGSYGIYSVAAFGLFSAVTDNKKGVTTCLLASQAMITSGVWVRLIKLIAGRERPMADYAFSKSEGGKWYGPLTQYDQDILHKKTVTSFDSFPSGHTATAFAIATVFASQYNDTKIVPVICYSAAGLVGITRLTEHEHWASDVFVGGLLGCVCGRQVVSHYNKMHQNPDIPLSAKPKTTAQLSFIQRGNQVGLALKW